MSHTGDVDTDVVIVGGGLAGLTVGTALSREGFEVTVLESNERVGGRAQSWDNSETGDVVDIGPHILLSEYPNMFQLLDVFGTRDDIKWEEDHFIILTKGGESSVRRQYPLPAPLHFAPTMLLDPWATTRDKLSNIAVSLYAMQMDEADVLRLDGMNAYSFLRRLGVTKQFIEKFWSFTSMAIMNVPIELCSAGSLMRFYKKFIGYSEFSFGFAKDGLAELFVPGAREQIESNGGQILLDSEVDELRLERGRVTGAVLTDGRSIRADHTVAAVPPQVLQRLGPMQWADEHDWFRELVHFHPSPYISPYIWFDRKLTDLRMWARTHSPQDLNCDFYDLSNIRTGWEDRPSVICSNIIYSRRAQDLPDEAIVERTVAEIAEFLPEASMDRVEHHDVHRIPMAIHCPHPGTERRRPPVRPGVDGLTLAGDYIQTHLPSSMESAVCSGWMAAEAILEDEGVDRQLARDHRPVEGMTGLVNRAARFLPTKRARRLVRRVRKSLLETG